MKKNITEKLLITLGIVLFLVGLVFEINELMGDGLVIIIIGVNGLMNRRKGN